jgi:hypothetical protein
MVAVRIVDVQPNSLRGEVVTKELA